MNQRDRSSRSSLNSAADLPVDHLPGLQPEDLVLLHAQDITHISHLWDRTCTPERQRQLAIQIQRPLKPVQKWSAMADLARIPGVGCHYCGVLLHIGIRSSHQLARASAPKLHQQILRLQVQLFRKRDRCPDQGTIAIWIRQAIFLLKA